MRPIGDNLSGRIDSRGKQKLNRCSTSGELDDFVLIDVDSDVPNVIIVDVEESVQKKLRKPSPRTVIDIDDEEVADGVYSNDNASTSASSSRSSAKPMHSKENGSRHVHGFGFECEGGSTESDCSDCEFLEGPAEELRYQWEQAYKRRKTTILTGVISGKDSATTQPHTFKQSIPTHMRNGEGKNNEEKTCESDFGNSLKNDGKQDPFDKFPWFFPAQGPSSPIPEAMRTGSSSMGNKSTKYAEMPHYVDVDSPSSSSCEYEHGGQEPFDDFVHSFPPPSSPNIPDAMTAGSSSMGKNSTRYAEKPHYVDVNHPSSSFYENEHVAQEPLMSTNKWDDSLNYPSEEHERKVSDEPPCMDNRQQIFGEEFDCDISEPFNDDPDVPNSKLSDDSDCEFVDRVAPMDVDEELPTNGFCSSHHYRTTNSNDRENSAAGQTSFGNFNLTNKVDLEEQNTMHCREPGIDSLQSHSKPETDKDFPSVQVEADGSNCDPSKGLSYNKTKDPLQDVGAKPCQIDLLTDRQKIKETDVYKRAMEEELASRQQQLLIQAQEAQRLRRRKKAESKRIMDMERRQKQRLEEMRETQKKDEENLNMKEKLRVEIRRELNFLEGSCRDMATLLQKLGVHVGGNLIPSQNDVQAAYKRALLKFHPDRASRTDMRQQVEAEEKFKLISRMKEKFSSAG